MGQPLGIEVVTGFQGVSGKGPRGSSSGGATPTPGSSRPATGLLSLQMASFAASSAAASRQSSAVVSRQASSNLAHGAAGSMQASSSGGPWPQGVPSPQQRPESAGQGQGPQRRRTQGLESLEEAAAAAAADAVGAQAAANGGGGAGGPGPVAGLAAAAAVQAAAVAAAAGGGPNGGAGPSTILEDVGASTVLDMGTQTQVTSTLFPMSMENMS